MPYHPLWQMIADHHLVNEHGKEQIRARQSYALLSREQPSAIFLYFAVACVSKPGPLDCQLQTHAVDVH